MPVKQDRISSKQLAMLGLLSIISMTYHFFPPSSLRRDGRAEWLAMLPVIPVICGLLYMLQHVYKKQPDKPLDVLVTDIFGPFFGRVALTLYLLWSVMFMALTIRFFSERIVSSIFVFSNPVIFIFLGLIPVAVALRGRLTALSRVNVVFVGLYLTMLIALIVFSLNQIDLTKLLPVGTKDIVPVFEGATRQIGLYSSLLLFNFLSGRVGNRQDMGKSGSRQAIMFMLIMMAGSIYVRSVFEWKLLTRTQNPIYSAIKNILLLGSFERLESLVMAVWVMSSFVAITLLGMVSITLLEKIGNLKNGRALSMPLLFLAFSVSLLFAGHLLELQYFYDTVVIWGNYILNIGLFLLLFGVGKLRKII